MLFMLVQIERRIDLPTEFRRGMLFDGETETAFAMNEATQVPLEFFIELNRSWKSFLLIVCTGRIITCHKVHDCTPSCQVPPDTQIFQQIAKFCNGH